MAAARAGGPGSASRTLRQRRYCRVQELRDPRGATGRCGGFATYAASGTHSYSRTAPAAAAPSAVPTQWVFDDHGKLVGAPWFGKDPDFDKSKWPLDPIEVTTWRGLLFAAIDPAEDLVTQLGDLVGELADEPIETYLATNSETVNFESNWKIYTANFVEGYHIPGVHPKFFAAINFEDFKTMAHRGFIRMTAPPRQGLFYRGKWLWMWPNWTLSLFEGGMNTSRINPISRDRTEQIYHFYFADTSVAREAERADTIARNIAVVREDCGICVSTHQNYTSGGYRAGPLSPRHEQGVHYFQQRVRKSLSP